LSDVTPHIRFPLFSLSEFAQKVPSLGLLSSEQMLQLYQFLGTGGNGVIKGFNANKRSPRVRNEFSWSTELKHPLVALSDDNLRATVGNISNWHMVAGDVEWNEGVHDFEVVMNPSGNGFIGAICSSHTDYNMTPPSVGASNTPPAYGFHTAGGNSYFLDQNRPVSGGAVLTGEPIGVRVDLDSSPSTISFFRSGVYQATPFNNLRKPLRPCLFMFNSNATGLLKFGGLEGKEAKK